VSSHGCRSLRHRRRDSRAAPLALRVRCWPLGAAAFSRCCRPSRIRRHAPQAATPAARVRFWALRAGRSVCINWLPTRRRHAPRAAAPVLPVRSGPLCAVVLPSIHWLRKRQHHTPQEKSFSSVADCYVQRRQPICMGWWPSCWLHAATASAPGPCAPSGPLRAAAYAQTHWSSRHRRPGRAGAEQCPGPHSAYCSNLGSGYEFFPYKFL